jgi:4-diphosphocytidyl-2-C-methyl-D-erythritol kinase
MPEVRVPAFAKINLRLEILGKRPDGFHELRTIFQTVSLKDELRLKLTPKPGIALRVFGNETLSQESIEKNLVYRAVDALRRELKSSAGVTVELHKSIPAGRGLGGGSSNAAAALLGYIRLTKTKIARERLFEIAASLGADVPFFLQGGRALGIGKGDEIYPLPDSPKRHILLVSPGSIHVPTPDAYRWLNAQPLFSAQLTNPAGNPRLYRFCALAWSLQGGPLLNDFEEAVFCFKMELLKPCWRVAVRRCLEFSRAQLRRAEPLLGFRSIRRSCASPCLATRMLGWFETVP